MYQLVYISNKNNMFTLQSPGNNNLIAFSVGNENTLFNVHELSGPHKTQVPNQMRIYLSSIDYTQKYSHINETLTS